MRKAYLLTCDENSDRARFSKAILNHIGFNVEIFKAIENENPVISHSLSMLEIYKKIAYGEDKWCYVFEDDINILEDIKLEEIMDFEIISQYMFFLGICKYISTESIVNTGIKIRGNVVYQVSNYVRGSHAIGLSKEGAMYMLKFTDLFDTNYWDIYLEKYTIHHPTNIVRGYLQSNIEGHFGVFYQDRVQFPSTLEKYHLH